MIIKIVSVGVFREITGKSNFVLEIPDTVQTVHEAIDYLDMAYDNRIKQELYLPDGTCNMWTRVLLNGRDIRFLDPLPNITHGDTLFISPVMAGG